MQMVPTLKTLARLLEKEHSRLEYILTSLVDCYMGVQETINQDSTKWCSCMLTSITELPSAFFSTTPEEQTHFTTLSQLPGLWQGTKAK